MMINRTVIIKGKVQGVFYRGSTREQAELLGVNGEVKNLPDGSVELIIEGNKEAVEQLIAWCHHGPQLAKVEEVIVKEGTIKGFKNFSVIRF